MKLLIAGDWQHSIYEPSAAGALRRLGCEVVPFRFGDHWRGATAKAERWALVALSSTRRLNRALIDACVAERPDAVLVWRGVHVFPTTLARLRRRGFYLVSYNNDDPFSPSYRRSTNLHQRRLWRWFLRGLPEYNLNFVYRRKNVSEYVAAGGTKPELLLPYYDPAVHFPEDAHKGEVHDVVFVGHYEPDERYPVICALRAAGLRVGIRGTGWEKCAATRAAGERIRPVTGGDYRRTICSAHFALSFYSKLNSDTYTRRVFEIPAMGTVLVTPRNHDVAELYRDGQEALFFDRADDAVERVKTLLARPDELASMAEAGRRRCTESGYDVDSRMAGFLDLLKARMGS